MLDTLDDNSHKHASGVSKDLKYALRECIEMLGNEVVYDMRERQHVGVFGKDLAEDLTLQCLRYMYRILFMLFIEAKPELGYAPMKADVYALGYSFESLREIADRARSDADMEKDGYYIKESLDLLFKLIYNGYPTTEQVQTDEQSVQGVFRIDPLKAHIFDPERTALIEKARIRNGVLLEIIDKMSLTRPQKGKRRGRISYSNLGINQLGSVYEALLSYRGFFAEEDLYEVKRKGDKVDDLDVGYFVPERELGNYDEDERVRVDENDAKSALRIHPKGEFIYRLAGREREKSASYYTPEVLTNCLVKYALKELLEGKTADEILHLTVCEPAMGSAAFLNEAVSQLAEAYLTRKEQELKTTVPHEERAQELQKIKMYIADRNVYGIDLNPTAVELAEVSLWLNTIYQGGYVPWFRTQIVNGNSLIGARRQCYTLDQLRAQKGSAVWYENAPERIDPDKNRKFSRQAYHFLMGDPGMCAYTDKVIKSLEPDKIQLIKDWNKKFTKPFNDDECDRVLELSAAIDKLWDAHVELRREIDEKTTDPLSVWGQPEDKEHKPLTIREKDKIYDELYLSHGAENASPYARLKAVMDYWCALWFWPIEKAEELPTRQEFLFDVQMLLGMDVISTRVNKKTGQIGLFDYGSVIDPYVQDMVEKYNQFGAVNLDRLRADFPRLKIANDVAQQQHFLHWELEFADMFRDRGGFDLVVGNPPWIKMEWNEQAVMGDTHPIIIVKGYDATKTTKIRPHVLRDSATRNRYFMEYESMAGTQTFLGAAQNYIDLKGQQTNLYKCFLPQAWLYGSNLGVSAFVHPNGVFDDPKGGTLRESLYPKLRHHFRFLNKESVFSDVSTSRKFSLNIYSNAPSDWFDFIANLVHPCTIDDCYDPNCQYPLYGLYDDNGSWCHTGHPDRIIRVSRKELKVFAKLFDGIDSWKTATLPAIHSKQIMDTLHCFANQNHSIGDCLDSFFGSEMWHETNSQKTNIICKNVHFPQNAYDMIYSGAHIGVANPLFKTSRRDCASRYDFDPIDLTNITSDYLQRCNFSPACEYVDYVKAAPETNWGEKNLSLPRIIMRNMLSNEGERTLMAALAPKNTGHVHAVYEFGFRDTKLTALMSGLVASIPFDFYIKVKEKASGGIGLLSGLPFVESTWSERITLNALRLNCLTENYKDVWGECWNDKWSEAQWSINDQRLNDCSFGKLDKCWSLQSPIRTDYARRYALVEIDVLTAMSLGMTLEQLKTIYRIQFPVMQKIEADTWYDACGRIVFTASTNLPGVGFERKEWETNVKGASAGTKFNRTIIDDTLPGGPVERTITYVAPFDKCDREKDYETAWEFFSRKDG